MLIRLQVALFCLVTAAWSVAAAEEPEVTLVIRNHRFEPPEVRVPAGRKVRLVVRNQDPAPEEFESHALNREKVIPANGKAVLHVGPLAGGRYAFVGEFNEKTARGVLIAE